MHHFPVGMEFFGAADEEQWQIIKETIDSSDYYVLIVGQRYGSVIEDGEFAGISYTEREFRYALEQGIPVLAFIIDDDVPVKPDDMEMDNPEKLKAFKTFVMKGRTVDRWKSADELARKVMASLYKQITRTGRPGWKGKVADNVAFVKLKSGIVHTQCDWFGGIYLIPRQKGEFKANVTLMCAEYEKPEEIDLTIVCE